MDKTRMEAFSDGVLAIIITIMVLELKAPHEPSLEALRPLVPVFFSYVLSFIFVGIYWNNHHHLLKVVECINGKILWANLHLLFWLSLIPFTTAWMGENQFAPLPVALYGVVLLCSGAAYSLLTRLFLSQPKCHPKLAQAIGKDRKGMVSLILYVIAIPLAFTATWAAYALYAAVALLWLLPDRRIEQLLEKN